MSTNFGIKGADGIERRFETEGIGTPEDPMRRCDEAHAYGEVAHGQVLVGSSPPTQLPNVPCRLARIKGLSTNAESVYVGGEDVTVPTAATDTTTGFEVGPAEDTSWFPLTNLNLLYLTGGVETDGITYLVVRDPE